MPRSESKTSTIPATHSDAAAVQQALVELMQGFGYSRQSVFRVRLALDDALVNAVNHSTQHGAGQGIQIKYAIDDQRIYIEVQDQSPVIFPSDGSQD